MHIISYRHAYMAEQYSAHTARGLITTRIRLYNPQMVNLAM